MSYFIVAKELKTGQKKKLKSSDLIELLHEKKGRKILKTYRPFAPTSSESFEKMHDYGRIKFDEATGANLVFKYWILAMSESQEELQNLLNNGTIKNPTRMAIGDEVEPFSNYSTATELKIIKDAGKLKKSVGRQNNTTAFIRKEFEISQSVGAATASVSGMPGGNVIQMPENPQIKDNVKDCSGCSEKQFQIIALENSLKEIQAANDENSKYLNEINELQEKLAGIQQQLLAANLRERSLLDELNTHQNEIKYLKEQLDENDNAVFRKNIEGIVKDGFEKVEGLFKLKEASIKTGLPLVNAVAGDDEEEEKEIREGQIYVGNGKYVPSDKVMEILRMKRETFQYKVERLSILIVGKKELPNLWLSKQEEGTKLFPDIHVKAMTKIFNEYNFEINKNSEVPINYIQEFEVREKLKRILYHQRCNAAGGKRKSKEANSEVSKKRRQTKEATKATVTVETPTEDLQEETQKGPQPELQTAQLEAQTSDI